MKKITLPLLAWLCLALSLAAFAPWVIWLVPGQAGSLYWRGEPIAASSLFMLGVLGVALRAWSLTVALPAHVVHGGGQTMTARLASNVN